jgi:hypothetical protein
VWLGNNQAAQGRAACLAARSAATPAAAACVAGGAAPAGASAAARTHSRAPRRQLMAAWQHTPAPRVRVAPPPPRRASLSLLRHHAIFVPFLRSFFCEGATPYRHNALPAAVATAPP